MTPPPYIWEALWWLIVALTLYVTSLTIEVWYGSDE